MDDIGMAYLIDFQSALPYAIGTYEENPEFRHHGTVEYCSYDAHLVNTLIYDFVRVQIYVLIRTFQGIFTMRGDLEMLGYNLFLWSSGFMKWENRSWSFAEIQQSKREFLDDLESMRKFFRYEHLGM